MSEDYTQGQPFPTVPGFGPQGAAAELQSVLDRVKDERLRMIRLLKDCETRFGTTGVVPPAEEIARLTGKVRAIDDAVRNRYDQLKHDETILEKRAYQVDQIREGVKELADQLNSQLNQARDYKPELSAAKKAVQEAMELIVSDARSQLNLLGDNVADRLGEYRHAQASGQEQLREARREIEKTFADIDQRLSAAAGLARDEAQKLIDPIFGQLENHATDCGQRVQQMIEAADNTIREKIEALPADAQKTLEPAREVLNSVISDAREQIIAVNDAMSMLDEKLSGVADQAEGIIELQLDSIAGRAGKALDEQLARRMAEQEAAFEQREQALEKKMHDLFLQKQAEMIVALDEQAVGLIDRLKAEHQQKFQDAVEERLDDVIAKAKTRADELSQQVHGQLTASLDQSHAEAAESVRRIESQAESIRKQADEKASEVARVIEDSLREHIVEAMSRADGITDPFKARLEDAVASHRAEAEEYSKAAEAELSAKAKAHWDAFSSETQAALDKQKQVLEVQAQDTINATQQNMKERVQELCAASQSMVDLLEQQLTRKLKAVEPQAQHTMESIEKLSQERLEQMRGHAEQMVKLTEDQLSKRVADLSPKAVSAARQAEQELHEHLARVRQEVENILVPLRRQAIEELGQIAEVGKNLRGSARTDTPQEPGSTEPPVVDPTRLTNPINEMANRMGKKAAKLINAGNENEPIPGQRSAESSDEDRKAA